MYGTKVTINKDGTVSDGNKLTWLGVSANNCLFRPAKFVAMCFTETTMRYSKCYKQKHQENAHNASDTSSCGAHDLELMLVDGHHGYRHVYLQKHAHLQIPLLSVPDGHMCPLRDL